MFKKILIANRGEIACRIIRTAKKLGIRCVAVYSEMDAHAQHVSLADEAYAMGGKTSLESYLNQQKILAIAHEAKVDAIHPGYGFLSENAGFAAKCIEEGIVFIGPPPDVISTMGSKSKAKVLMEEAKIPVIPGYHGQNQKPEFLAEKANEIGYPVLIKAVSGGGGKGMRVVSEAKDFIEALASAKREALSAFGDDDVLLEKYFAAPRHIEIQIFADTHGNIVHLFERDCSIQRRHQKIIEESPAVNFADQLRNEMTKAAILAARAVGYVGAGTIEFLVDKDQFYFMEMNTRLQVEHPVTEKITGIDLVEWQLRVASGESLPLLQSQISMQGHAIEVRLYAEDPEKDFLPSTGSIYFLQMPEENRCLRLDTGVVMGDVVTPYYDPMLGKLIAWGETRKEALQYLASGLAAYQLVGVNTNRNFLQHVIQQPDFVEGKLDTYFVTKYLTNLCAKKELSDLAIVALSAYIVLTQKENAKTLALETNDPYSPWALADAWQLNSSPIQTLSFCYFEEIFTVKVIALENNFQIMWDEKNVTAHSREAVVARSEATKQSRKMPGLPKLANNASHCDCRASCHCERSAAIAMTGSAAIATSANMIGHEELQKNYSVNASLLKNGILIGLADREYKVHIMVYQDKYHLFLKDETAIIKPYLPSIFSDTAQSKAHLTSPLPGTLTAVFFEEGSRVEAGSRLAIIEAMKMEHTIRAPHTGVVKHWYFKVGDLINEGEELLVFEEESRNDATRQR